MGKKERTPCKYPEEERKPEEKCANPEDISDKDLGEIVKNNIQVLKHKDYRLR